MIVRTRPDRVQLITQPDHAQLARRIMERCVPLLARTRRDSILRATGAHDDGWAQEDATPAVDPPTGNVVDFVQAPVAVRQRVWPRTIAHLDDDPWAAVLVAHHALTAYARFRSDSAWTSFFARMESSRDATFAASGLAFDELAADYAFVRLGDLISLAFCTGSTEQIRYDIWTVELSGTRVMVVPDPFGGDEIPIAVEARELPRSRFASDAELAEALREAGATTLRGEVAGRGV